MARKTALSFALPPAWPDDVEHGGEHIIVVGRWMFYVESESSPGEYHALDLEGVEGEVGKCTCESGTARKWCRHERVVRDWCGLTSS